MIDVKELLRRWSACHSNRKIARETGADRDTVGRYVEVAKELGLERGHEFTEAEVHEIAQRVQARPVRDVSAEWNAIAANWHSFKHRVTLAGAATWCCLVNWASAEH